MTGLGKAAVFAAVVATGSGCEKRPSKAQLEDFRRFTGATKVERSGQALPSFRVPFQSLPAKEEIFYVRVPLELAPGTSLKATTYFHKDGRFVGAESVQKIEDGFRMSPQVVEERLRGTHEGIVSVSPTGPKFDLPAVWKKVSQRVDVRQIREFSLYYVDYQFSDGTRPAVIVNIWGPKNPLQMTETDPPAPPGMLDRIRFIYDVEKDSYEADNLL